MHMLRYVRSRLRSGYLGRLHMFLLNKPSLYERGQHLYALRVNEEVLREFVPRLRWRGSEDEAVLDVGCGPGTVTASLLLPLLPPRVRRVVGADLAPEMVHYAQTTHAHADPRLRFVQADIAAADIDATPLRAEAGARGFSKIFSLFLLQCVQNQRAALSNMHQLLEPEGESLLLFIAQCPVFTAFEDLSRVHKWQPHMKDVSEFIGPHQNVSDPGRDFSDLLKEVGFHVIECRWIQMTQVTRDMDLLKDFLASLNPFVDRIPDINKEQFTEDYFQEFLKQKQVSVSDDKTVQISYSILISFIEKRKY